MITYSKQTLEEISGKIGISRTTIYNVLNHKAHVSEATRKRVLDALDQFHYTPNYNARNLAINKKYSIALIKYESPNAPYFSPAIERGIEKAAADFGDNGLDLSVYTADSLFPKKQLQYIRDAFENGIRSFIIAAAEPSYIRDEITSLKKQGCSVIVLSKPVPDVPFDTFIGIDDYKSGVLAGGLLGKMLCAGGNLQILLGERSYSSTDSMQARLSGFTDTIQTEYRDIHILPPLEKLHDRESIFSSLDNLLQSHSVQGIYDLSYHPELVAQYIKEHESFTPRLVVMDLFPEITASIRDGTIDAVIFQNLEAQAYQACSLLFYEMCYGRSIEKKCFYQKLEIVMKGNLEYFSPEQGTGSGSES
jgi:LacI family transcriptional regulator